MKTISIDQLETITGGATHNLTVKILNDQYKLAVTDAQLAKMWKTRRPIRNGRTGFVL